MLTGFWLAAVGGMKEETSSPHSRLACIHLQELLYDLIGR